jgi:beta-galactosidase/beta-glucuronidase
MDIHELLAGTDTEGHAYPRPMLVRQHWRSLNGLWEFAVDRDAEWTSPAAVRWQGEIRVPFAPETEASGVNDNSFFNACWYRRTIPGEPIERGERLILHFGAVDYRATVWVNGHVAAHHEGGYTPFQVDITRLSVPGEPITLVVRAEDDPHELAKPRGKQDWQLAPHSIW